jgi:hypothetical protein
MSESTEDWDASSGGGGGAPISIGIDSVSAVRAALKLPELRVDDAPLPNELRFDTSSNDDDNNNNTNQNADELSRGSVHSLQSAIESMNSATVESYRAMAPVEDWNADFDADDGTLPAKDESKPLIVSFTLYLLHIIFVVLILCLWRVNF